MQYRLFYTIFVLIILQSVSFAKGEFREKNATINPPKSFFDSYGEVILIKDSVERGRALFMQKMKKACGMNGADFAATHTQEAWHKIKLKGKFAKEVQSICPNLKNFQEKWHENIFDFSYEFASDSGNVPSCG